MTRILFVLGLLLASTPATPPARATTRNANALATGASESCLAQYRACSFNTDRPVNQPDCFEQFMACLQEQIG